jgi:hypothetical protein
MPNTRDTSQKVPPDAEIIARAWALSQTPITDLVGTRISTRLPRDAGMPFLVLFRAGGNLLNPRSEAHIQNALIPMECYAGRWGGTDDTAVPDYGGAMTLANTVIQAAFNYSNEYIQSSDGLKAKIYSFDIIQMPTRIEETATGLGRYAIALSMTYRDAS